MSFDQRSTLPTKINLIKLKRDVSVIRKIRRVLDEKRSALLLYLRAMIDEYEKLYAETAEELKRAYSQYQTAILAVGYKKAKEVAEATPESLAVDVKTKITFAVKTPHLSIIESSYPPLDFPVDVPISLLEARKSLQSVFPKLLKIVELEGSILKIINELKTTQRLINSIDYALLPKYERTIKYISMILDERMREEFMRLKVLKNKKEKLEKAKSKSI